MLDKIRQFIEQQLPEKASAIKTEQREQQLAAAALLIEVARADTDMSDDEREAIWRLLQKELGLSDMEAEQFYLHASQLVEDSISLYDFTKDVKSLSYDKRVSLLSALWQVAYADGVLDPHEEALIRHIAELIYVRHPDFIRTKLAVAPDAS